MPPRSIKPAFLLIMASMPIIPVSSRSQSVDSLQRRSRSRSPKGSAVGAVPNTSGGYRSPLPSQRPYRVRSRSESPPPLSDDDIDRSGVVTTSGRYRSPHPTRHRYRVRSRSISPPPVSDDGIDPSLDGQDGLHVGQRATSARRKNPGKYTDKSMRRLHSTRSKRRERSAMLPAIIGGNDDVRGACVNDFGMIRPCRDLVTRVNYRPTYVKKDRLPLQMLFAMLLDEQPEVVSTYDESRVRTYLAGVIARALSGTDHMEPTGSNNLVGFANRAVNLLSQIESMTGNTDPIVILAERYMSSITNMREACQLIRASIRHVRDTSVLNILTNLRTLVNDAIPQVRLWAYDSDSPQDVKTVLLRRGQLREHPMDQLKYALDRSIELFQTEGNIRRVLAVPLPQRRDSDDDMQRNVGPRGGLGRLSTRSRVVGRLSSGKVKRSREAVVRRRDTATRERSRPRNRLPSIDVQPATPDLTTLPPTPGRFLDDQPTAVRKESTVPPAAGKGRGEGKRKRVGRPSKTAGAIPDWLADVDNW